MSRSGQDMETGFVRYGDSSDSSKGDSLRDALFGSTARRAVTAITAVVILALLITVIAIAAKLANVNSATVTVVVQPSSTGGAPLLPMLSSSGGSSAGPFITSTPTPPTAAPAPTSTPTPATASSSTGSSSPVVVPVPYAGRFMSYPGNPDRVAAAMPVNLTIGFIADTYITEDTQTLYRQMKADGAEVILISGDLDYIEFPQGWDELITKTLGADYPVLVASGNHDYAVWPEYQERIIKRWQAAGMTNCEGVVGVAHVCTWKGVTIVQVTPGVFNETRGIYRNLTGIGNVDYVQFIRDAFAKYPSAWKVCSWHKNQHLMQTGDKTDETGWGVYNECLAQSAMVMTGHEHSYERSYQMLSFQEQKVKTRDSPKQLTLTPTDGIVVVQGLGGRGIRVNKLPRSDWWAALDNADTGARFSANVCKYNLNGNAKQAYCYAKDIGRRIVDEYYITLP